MCRASCEHKVGLPDLEVFVDGQKLEPTSTLDDKYDLSNTKFDKQFYNTPEAFSDILNFKGQLLNAFYEIAQNKFKTPGRKYNSGTLIHLLKVPIPLTDSQFNNQEFMDKLLDIVPKGQKEYEPASSLQLSEAYKEFLLSVKVDTASMKDAPSSAQDQAEIRKREAALDALIDQYIALADKCYVAYEAYIAKNMLSPISYTLETYTPLNANCRAADAKLNEHAKKSEQLADFVESLNPYNLLFKSIAKATHNKATWDYSKSEIQQFANYHRELDGKNIVTSSTSYSIPVTIKRELFNHNYFGGNSATYSEKNIDAHLTFSGVGWKETAISPSAKWFDMFSMQKYRKSPLNTKKDFFSSKGILQRIPSYMLIAYKPILKVKISREMKDGFSKTATTHKLRPVESGPFVFTKVEIRTNNGGKTKEEYEMILSCNIRQPQIIAFKSTPVVYIPQAPAPAPPAYLKFVGKQVSFTTPSKTFLRVAKADAGSAIVTNTQRGPEERWIVKGTTDNRVTFSSTWGPLLSCNDAKAETTKTVNNNSKFTMIQDGSQWILRAANGRYLRNSANSFNCVTALSQATKFTISSHSPLFLQFLNKKVTIQASNGKHLRANNEGANVTLQSAKGASEQWRVVYLGYERIGFLAHNGRYLDAPHDTSYTKKKKVFGITISKKTIHVPAKVRVSSGITDCKKFTLKAEGNKFALKPVCRSGYIKVNSDSELGLNTSITSTSKFAISLV